VRIVERTTIFRPPEVASPLRFLTASRFAAGGRDALAELRDVAR
jgi:hypothetical protein